jgi:hypothetical protein
MTVFDLDDPCLTGVLPAAAWGGEHGGQIAQGAALYAALRGGSFDLAGLSEREAIDRLGAVNDALSVADALGRSAGPSIAAFAAYGACQIGTGLASLTDVAAFPQDANYLPAIAPAPITDAFQAYTIGDPTTQTGFGGMDPQRSNPWDDARAASFPDATPVMHITDFGDAPGLSYGGQDTAAAPTAADWAQILNDASSSLDGGGVSSSSFSEGGTSAGGSSDASGGGTSSGGDSGSSSGSTGGADSGGS